MGSVRAAVGYSALSEPRWAAREAAEQALKAVGRPTLTFLFTTDAYDQRSVWKAVKEVVGNSKMVGFCAGGIITGGSVLRKGVGVLVLGGKGLRVATSLQTGLSQDPFDAGRRAGRQLLASGIDKGTIFVFPDGFASDISEALRGLYSVMGAEFKYIGGGAGDNLRFFKTYQFTEAAIESDALAVALLDGVAIEAVIGHGWRPKGEPLVVNRARGRRVFEIDGRPAFEAYSERLGGISRDNFAEWGMRHPLGFPDIWGNYLIRDPLKLAPDGSIEFVTEVPRDAVGYMMDCDVAELNETARLVADKAVQGVSGPRFALIFDCISRYLLMGEDFERELRAMKESIGEGIPMLGVLTFGEVGSHGEVPFFHNKTVAVAVGAEALSRHKGRDEGEGGEDRGLHTAELSALYEISSIRFEDSKATLMEFVREAMERAVRLFGVSRYALFIGLEGHRELVTSWGFRDSDEVQKQVDQEGPNRFRFALGDKGEMGLLLMEKASPIKARERRLYTIFARQLERALLIAQSVRERERTLQLLKESEACFRALVEQSLVGVYIVAGGRVLYANEALAQMFGYRLEEVIEGLRLPDVIHPDDRAMVMQRLEERLAGKAEFAYYVFRGLRRDGSVIFCEAFGRSVELGGKRVVIGTVIDVTEQRRAEEELRRQRDELELRNRIMGRMVKTLDLDERLNSVLDEAMALLRAEMGGIYLVKGEQLVLHCWRGFLQEVRPQEFSYPLREVPPWLIEASVLRDEPDAEGGMPDFAKREGIRVLVSMPLVIRKAFPDEREAETEWLGTILLASRSPEAFPEEYIEALQFVADQLSLAIDHSHQYQQAKQRLARLEVLQKIDQAIIAHLSTQDALRLVVEAIPKEFGGDAVAVSLIDRVKAQTLSIVMRLPDGDFLEKEVLNLFDGLLPWFLKAQEPVIIYDLSEDPRMRPHRDLMKKYGLVSYLGVPLVVEDETLGILHMMTSEPRVFTDEYEFLKSLADEVAIALKSARLIEDLRSPRRLERRQGY